MFSELGHDWLSYGIPLTKRHDVELWYVAYHFEGLAQDCSNSTGVTAVLR